MHPGLPHSKVLHNFLQLFLGCTNKMPMKHTFKVKPGWTLSYQVRLGSDVWMASLYFTQSANCLKTIMEEKLLTVVCARPELKDTKSFKDQNRAVKEKTWSKIQEICTSFDISHQASFTCRRWTCASPKSSRRRSLSQLVKCEHHGLKARPRTRILGLRVKSQMYP